MKCPKCGYHSFEHLDECKKCGNSLVEHKAKFNLRGLFFPGQTSTVPEPEPEAAVAAEEAPAEEGDVDFGFDFLEEDEEPAAAGASPAAEAFAEEEPASAEDTATAEAFEEDTSADEGIDLGTEDDISIDQPFSVDGETVPADESTDEEDSSKKPDSEFSF